MKKIMAFFVLMFGMQISCMESEPSKKNNRGLGNMYPLLGVSIPAWGFVRTHLKNKLERELPEKMIIEQDTSSAASRFVATKYSYNADYILKNYLMKHKPSTGIFCTGLLLQFWLFYKMGQDVQDCIEAIKSKKS